MNPGTIQSVTQDCQRQDCSLTYGGGMSTCMAYTPTYDREGKRTDRGDPNIYTSTLCCSACGRSWGIVTQYGTTTITEEKR